MSFGFLINLQMNLFQLSVMDTTRMVVLVTQTLHLVWIRLI